MPGGALLAFTSSALYSIAIAEDLSMNVSGDAIGVQADGGMRAATLRQRLPRQLHMPPCRLPCLGWDGLQA